MILARAPLRICLGGGGTDLPFYSLKHTGHLISAAINKYIYVSVNPSLTQETTLRYEDIEQVDSVEQLNHGIVRETLNYFKIRDPLHITISSSVPSGTGMGSSSSLAVAMIKLLLELLGEQTKYGSYDIAQLAYHIERIILKEEGGKQDQFISAFGGIKEMVCHQDGSVTLTDLPLSPQTIEKLEQNLALFYIGINRSSSTIQKKVSEQAKIEQLHYIKDLGLRLKEALVEGRIDELGSNWNEHWGAKKKLASGVSNSLIDSFYDLAIKNGALGGKLIGAGGGGFLIFYTKDKEGLIDLLEKKGLKYLRFSFTQGGAEIFYKD